MKENASKKGDHKSGTRTVCVPLLLNTLICIYNHLKLSSHVLLLKTFLVIFLECIKHSAKYQIIFRVVLLVTGYYRGNTSGFLSLWLLFFFSHLLLYPAKIL